jgi:hypothetical protein
MLRAMKGLVLAGPALPRSVGGGDEKSFCLDPNGTDVLATPAAVLEAACGDCKKLSILAARRYIEAGARRVELCMTVDTELDQEHVFLRVDGQLVDPAVDAGMPVRTIGPYITEVVWPPLSDAA